MSALVSCLRFCVLLRVGTAVLTQRMNISDCASQKMELVFVQDASFSVSESSFQMAKTFVTDTIRKLPIGPDRIRVAIVRYGTEADVITGLDDSTDVDSVTDAVDRMEYKVGGTDTALALHIVKQVLREARPDARSVVVVITDGASVSPRKTRLHAKRLRDDEVRLVWLYIMADGQNSLGRERKSMEQAGDKILQVNRFDDLGEDTIWQILDASCKEPEPEPTTTTEEPTTTTEEPATTTEEPATTTEEPATTTEEPATTTEEPTTTTEEPTTTTEEPATSAEETKTSNATLPRSKSAHTATSNRDDHLDNPSQPTATTAEPQGDSSSPESGTRNSTTDPQDEGSSSSSSSTQKTMTSSTPAAEHEEMSSVPRGEEEKGEGEGEEGKQDLGDVGEVEGGEGLWRNSPPKVIGTVVGVFGAIAVGTCIVLAALRKRDEKRRRKAKQEP